MAWAIFHRECNWSRPLSRFSFNVKASDIPQERPHDFIDYCVGRGWATRIQSPRKEDAEAIRQKRKSMAQ